MTTDSPALAPNVTAHLQHVYVVHVIWDGESGCDMFPLGLYANELHARRVAKDHKLCEGERIEVGFVPILDAPEEEGSYIEGRGGDPVGHGCIYRRDA